MIPVYWWNAERRGSWSCCNLLNEMFDLYHCEHHDRSVALADPSIIVIHGERQADPVEITNAVKELDWCIFVVIGDEEGHYPAELLYHPNSRLWRQTPLPFHKADRYLIEGYPAHTKRVEEERSLLWFFAGQDTHQRRHACVEALRGMEGGLMLTTQAFGSGIPQADYLRYMSRALVVPCPSGPASPDTFRIWEALECGAVPIVDARSLRDETVGFWGTVLGKHPLPVIEDWGMLPDVMLAVLRDYSKISRLTQFWWRGYKLEFRNWLQKDLIALRAI